jgi:regulatory protein
VAEVRRRLATAGYRSDLVEGAIARLLEIGILDDDVFARLWIESRDRARPRGAAALRRELRLKGVDASLIDEVLAGRGGGDDPAPDATAADALLARSARTLARVPDPRARRQRAYALLARHGFDPDTAADAVRRFVATPDTDDS